MCSAKVGECRRGGERLLTGQEVVGGCYKSKSSVFANQLQFEVTSESVLKEFANHLQFEVTSESPILQVLKDDGSLPDICSCSLCNFIFFTSLSDEYYGDTQQFAPELLH